MAPEREKKPKMHHWIYFSELLKTNLLEGMHISRINVQWYIALTWKGMFGISFLSCSSLSQGHSWRNLEKKTSRIPIRGKLKH